MKHYLKSTFIIIGLRFLQALLFLIPLGIMMIIYRDTFFVEKTGYGLAGLGIVGLIIYILALAKVIGKTPSIVWFAFVCAIFYSMNFLADFLVQIGNCMFIGACLALPVNFFIKYFTIDGETDLVERSKIKAKKRMNKEKVEIEVEQ